MAHLLETVNGKVSMAYVGETPWHGLGNVVSNDLTPKQMMIAAGVDWKVEKKPLTIQGTKTVVPGYEALVRDIDGKVLTIITDAWKPVQNEEAFEFFKEFTNAGQMEMHTAGSLRDGKMVWALAKIKKSFKLFNGKDVIESHLLFSNPHEYGRSVDVRFTPIRVVCNNTLTLALGKKSADMQVNVNHRSEFNPDDVAKALGLAEKKLGDYKDMAEFLASKRYTDKSVTDYLNEIFPHSTVKAKVDPVKAMLDKANDNAEKMSRGARLSYDSLETQPGAEYGKGSWWSAFNATTFNIDHVLGHETSTRLNSAWYGPNRARKVKALELAVDYAGKSKAA